MNKDVTHILVVDDEPDLELLIRQRFRKQIKEELLHFSFALNGVDALRRLHEDEHISVLMTDINMPVMDGLTLLNEIKSISRPLKSIVVSAYSDLANIRVAMNRGAFDFVTKPIDFTDLETTIQRTINEQRMIQEGFLARKNLDLAIIEKENAEQSSRFKQQFLANMSHEMRTPLNAVVGMTNLLLEKEPREDQRKYLKAMHLASENLLGIVNDILNLSKIEAGKITLEKIDFNLHKTIDGVHQTLHLKAEEGKINFTYEIDPKLPQWISGDPGRLTQVLTNLAGNAIKFTEENGSIVIRCILKHQFNIKNIIILFEVEDTGIGIPESQMGKLFESFTQASSDTTRKYGGTGLGLSISKQLVELQNGEISVTSKTDVGTLFKVLIPYEIAAAPTPEVNVLIKAHVLNKTITILLAEDQPMNQMVAVDTLESLFPGIIIDVANNGQEAIIMAATKNYDLIFMDIHMPLVDGYEASRTIRGNDANIPIVALTANAIKEEIDKCIEAGMNRHLAKPFEPALLRSTVLDLISQSKQD